MIIKNEADKVTIELFGEIGESWFEEGNTMETINAELKQAKGKPINLIVSSLGGSVDHALAMHDLLKMHDAPVTAKIIGATASSGTIVALGAGTVEMSENALFLVHNAWTMAAGNAKEFRQAADELDVWDSRIVSIYQSKTGKRKSQIHTLMEEEKWIDASEAKDFGFIDATFKPTAQAKILTEDEKKNILNKIKIVMNKDFKEINNILEVEGLVIDEEKGTYLQSEQIEAINTALTVDNVEAIAVAVNDAEVAHKVITDELEAKVEGLESETALQKTEIEDAKKLTDEATVLASTKATETFEALQAKFDALETEHNTLKVKGMPLNNGEPNIDGETLSERDKVHQANAKQMVKQIEKFDPKK